MENEKRGTIINNEMHDGYIKIDDPSYLWGNAREVFRDTAYEGLKPVPELQLIIRELDGRYRADVIDLERGIVLVSNRLDRDDVATYLLSDGKITEFLNEFDTEEDEVLEVKINKTLALAVRCTAQYTGKSLLDVLMFMGPLAELRERAKERAGCVDDETADQC